MDQSLLALTVVFEQLVDSVDRHDGRAVTVNKELIDRRQESDNIDVRSMALRTRARIRGLRCKVDWANPKGKARSSYTTAKEPDAAGQG